MTQFIGQTFPSPECVGDPSEDFAVAAVGLSSAGEWYVWQDSENKTVQLLSRTHGAITPKLPNDVQQVADLTAAAIAVNYVRSLAPVTEPQWTPRQVMPKVNGVGFRCECGCNVFTETQPLRYSCNSCGSIFAGERDAEGSTHA